MTKLGVIFTADRSPEDARLDRASVRTDSDLVAEITKLREAPGGDVRVNGSAQLAQALVDHALVDERRLAVFPCVLGAGKRLFTDATAAAVLALAESRPLGNDGVILLTYRPKARS